MSNHYEPQKNKKCNMKVSQVVNYYFDYHKMNSKKKYDKESRVYTFQVPEPV